MSSMAAQPNIMGVNPLTQQVVTIPTVFNSQMMCPPYVYHQQQQVIMSSGPLVVPLVPKPLPAVEYSMSPPEDSEQTFSVEKSPDKEDIGVQIDSADVSPTPCKSKLKLFTEHGDDPSNDLENSIVDEVAGVNVKDSDNEIDDVGISCFNGNSIEILDMDEDSKIVGNLEQQQQQEEHSIASSEPSWGLRVRSDLDKSCQTQGIGAYGELQNDSHEDVQSECFYSDIPGNVVVNIDDNYTDIPDNVVVTSSNYTVMQNVYNESSYTMTATSHNNNTYGTHGVPSSLMDMDGMNLLITNDFLTNHVVSQVDDFDCSSLDRPRVLMNLEVPHFGGEPEESTLVGVYTFINLLTLIFLWIVLMQNTSGLYL